VQKLIQLGISKNNKNNNNNNNNHELKKEINKILQNYTASIDTTEEIPKKYLDIIKAQFEITKLESIERRDDNDTISAKDADFTSETIDKLIKMDMNRHGENILNLYCSNNNNNGYKITYIGR
jgi:hypothetical protein